MARYKHGFSLVELSIVLVILGLLVGGILTGQSNFQKAVGLLAIIPLKTSQTLHIFQANMGIHFNSVPLMASIHGAIF